MSAATINLDSGKSTLFRLPEGTTLTLRTLGDEDVVQARMLNPQTLYLLGAGIGSTNMILQDARGVCTIVDVTVGMDAGASAGEARAAAARRKGDPGGRGCRHDRADRSSSRTRSPSMQAVSIANAYVRQSLDGGRLGSARGGSGGGREGNRRRRRSAVRTPGSSTCCSVSAPQQVLLEVKVAEIAKKLVDKLGASVNLNRVNGRVDVLDPHRLPDRERGDTRRVQVGHR